MFNRYNIYIIYYSRVFVLFVWYIKFDICIFLILILLNVVGYICIQSCEAGLAFKVYISYILYSAEYGIHFLYSLLSYNPPPSPLHLSTHRLPSSFLLPALSPLRLPTNRLPSSFLLPALSPLRLPTHRLPSSFLLPPVSLSYSSVHPSFLLLPLVSKQPLNHWTVFPQLSLLYQLFFNKLSLNLDEGFNRNGKIASCKFRIFTHSFCWKMRIFFSINSASFLSKNSFSRKNAKYVIKCSQNFASFFSLERSFTKNAYS